MPPVAVAMVLLAVFAGIALGGLRWVPEGTVCTVHRFGHYVRALGPGLHLCWPVIDHIAHRVNMIGHQVELPLGSDAYSATVYFQILHPEQTGIALEQIDAMVEREALQRLQVLIAGAERTTWAAQLKQELNAQLGAIGLRITRCQLRGS